MDHNLKNIFQLNLKKTRTYSNLKKYKHSKFLNLKLYNLKNNLST